VVPALSILHDAIPDRALYRLDLTERRTNDLPEDSMRLADIAILMKDDPERHFLEVGMQLPVGILPGSAGLAANLRQKVVVDRIYPLPVYLCPMHDSSSACGRFYFAASASRRRT